MHSLEKQEILNCKSANGDKDAKEFLNQMGASYEAVSNGGDQEYGKMSD